MPWHLALFNPESETGALPTLTFPNGFLQMQERKEENKDPALDIEWIFH